MKYKVNEKEYTEKQLKKLSDSLKKVDGNRHIVVRCIDKNKISDVKFLDEIFD